MSAGGGSHAGTPARGPGRSLGARLTRNESAIAGLALIVPVLALVLIAPAFYPVDPFDIVWRPLAPPGDAAAIPLGSDFVGRDVLAGIIHGGQTTLAVGLSAAALCVVVGIAVGAAILFEAGLAFLGLGNPDAMSWGLMMGANRDFVVEAWWTVALPGLAIFVTVLGVSLVGDGLTDALDPKR